MKQQRRLAIIRYVMARLGPRARPLAALLHVYKYQFTTLCNCARVSTQFILEPTAAWQVGKGCGSGFLQASGG